MPDDFIDAARRGDLSVLRAALGADPGVPGAVRTKALDAACAAGQLAAARLLLQHGAVITKQTWITVSTRADPALVFLLETADLERPLPPWLAASIAKEEAIADLPAILDTVAGGTPETRRQALDQLASAVQAGAPLAPVMASLERALEDADPDVAAAAARLVDALARTAHDVPPALHGRALVHVLSQSPEAAALLTEALASAGARGRDALSGLVQLIRGGPAVEAVGRGARVAALELALAALRRQPADWSEVDRLCRHVLPLARQGALSAVGLAWGRHQAGPECASRLLAGLTDESDVVRTQAAARLEAGWREGLAPVLDDATLTLLAAALRTPAKSKAIVAALTRFVVRDAVCAARLLELLAGDTADGSADDADGPVTELARLCREVVEGRHPAPCAACGMLEAEESWGEYPGSSDVPPPPQFERLQRCVTLSYNRDLYRCPECASYFERQMYEDTFISGNSTYDNYTLTRRGPPQGDHDVLEYARARDFAGLARVVLDPRDDAARLQGLAALARLVSEGLDVTALEGALRTVAGSAAAPVRKAAASVLALQQLRTNRIADVARLIESEDEAQRSAALAALREGADKGWAAAPKCAGRVRSTLWTLVGDANEDVHYPAVHVLSTVCLAEGGASTVEEATRGLDSGLSLVRRGAARVLEAAADRGLDVRRALPRLAALLLDDDAGTEALDALGKAHLKGADVAPFVPTLSQYLRAKPRASGALNVTHILHALQERGVDISPAFEPLALMGGDWPLAVLKHAVERGRDIAAAIPSLQRMAAEDESYLGRTAVEILAHHFVRARDWSRLEPLVKHPNPERANAARTVVERAVRSGEATHEALLFLGRLLSAATLAEPGRTSWSLGQDHVEVNEREVVRWTDGPFGGNGQSCGLDEFLAGTMQVDVSGTFGPGVLVEVVDAARRMAPPKKRGQARKRKSGA